MTETTRARIDPYTHPKERTRSRDTHVPRPPSFEQAVKLSLMTIPWVVLLATNGSYFAPLRWGIAGLVGLLALVACWALGEAVWTTIRFLREQQEGWKLGAFVGLAFAVPLGLMGAIIGVLGAYVSFFPGSVRGRQIRRFGRPLFGVLRDSSPWLAHPWFEESSSSAPVGVGEAWRQNGKTEHASVAAFARLSLDLVTLGAPPRLVEAAHRDALDELRHTELCFSFARALDGRDIGPHAMPHASRGLSGMLPRSLAVARLAVDSLVDGALNEGVSARIVARLARSAPNGPAYALLAEIARDEARHAAHGFDVVRWCLREGGPATGAAIRTALAVLRRAPAGSSFPVAADGRWERWGIPGRATEIESHAVVRDRLVARTERLLAEVARRDFRLG